MQEDGHRIHTLYYEKLFLKRLGTGVLSTHNITPRLELLKNYKKILKNKRLDGWYGRKLKGEHRKLVTEKDVVLIKKELNRFVTHLIEEENTKVGTSLAANITSGEM
jgi:hypothetical protein